MHPIFLPYKMELLKKVIESESTKNIWRNNYNSQEWQNASKLNKQLFGLHLNQSTNCQCLEDLFLMLKRESTKNKIMNQFQLKKGCVVTSFVHSTLTEFSTDDEFIAALKVSPGTIKYFTSFPENWQDIVNGKVKQITPTQMRKDLKEKSIAIPKGTTNEELTKLWQESK